MKNILSIAALAAIVSTGAVGGANAGVNLVQDGSFATSTTHMYYGVANNKYWSDIGYYGATLRGWVSDPLPGPPFFTNGNTLSFAGLTAPTKFVYMDAEPGQQVYAITQTISGLKAGNKYSLAFLSNYFTENNSAGDSAAWVANLGGSIEFASPNGTYSSFKGGDTESTLPTNIPTGAGGYNVPNGTGWFAQNLTLTASSSSEALTFIATGTGFPPFAAITDISLTAVPEPSTWLMMLAGIFGLGFMARRRRSISAAEPAA